MKTLSLIQIAEALESGATALTDLGLARYVATQARILSEDWQHPNNKKTAQLYLAAGQLAIKLRTERSTK